MRVLKSHAVAIVPLILLPIIITHFMRDPEVDWRIKVISPMIKSFFYTCGMFKGGSFSRTCASIAQIPVRTTNDDYDGICTIDIQIPNYHTELWKSHTNGIPARVFLPSKSLQSDCTDSKLPLILFFHGGGYAICSTKNLVYDSLLRMLARRMNVVIMSVDYSLAPEYPFPAALYDVCSSFQYINDLSNSTMRNKWEATYADHIDFNRVIVVGDSAGANLAYRVAFLARDHEMPLYPSYVFDPSAFNTHPLDVDIKYQILLFPGTGALKTKDDLEKAYYLDSAVIDFFWSSSMGDLNDTETEYINTVIDFEFMYRQRKQKGLPDAMIVSGSRDPLHRDAQQFAKQMSDEGVNVTMRMYNSSHAFHLLQFLEESKDVYNLIENVLSDRNLTGNYRCKF